MTENDLEAIVRAHQAEIYRYVRYLGANDSVAEDLVQDTFIAAFQAGKQPDLTLIKERIAWLRGICRNLFFNYCRKEKRRKNVTSLRVIEQAESFWATSFLDEGGGFDYLEALRKCLTLVSGKNRRVLDWFYSEGLSREKTAEAAEMSSDGVKSLLKRLRLKLGDCVNRRLNQEGAS